MRRTLFAVLLVTLLLMFVGTAYVWASINGRGGRAVSGERHVTSSAHGPAIVFFERVPEGRPKPTPVVLMASFARSVADFNELTAALASEGYRTLAIESRGIGGSAGGGPGQDVTLHDLADDLGRVLADAAGVESDSKVYLVGHAFGNRVVRTFAADHPERVESVILIAAGGLVPIAREEIVRGLSDSVTSFLPWSRREAALRLVFFSEGSEIPQDWIGGWSGWGGFVQREATSSTPSEDFWGAGGAELLVLQGEDDTIAPPKDAGLRLAAAFPERVELVSIPNAGHAMLPEQPVLIRDAVIAYLAR